MGEITTIQFPRSLFIVLSTKIKVNKIDLRSTILEAFSRMTLILSPFVYTLLLNLSDLMYSKKKFKHIVEPPN